MPYEEKTKEEQAACCQEYSLSIDEYGFCAYWAVSRFMSEAYFQANIPGIQRKEIQKRLTSGWQALIVHAIAREDQDGSFVLDKGLEYAATTQFYSTKLLGLMISKTESENESGHTNIWMRNNGMFTAHRRVGETVRLWHGKTELVPELVSSWVGLSKPPAPDIPVEEIQKIGLETLVLITGLPLRTAELVLRKKGITDPWLKVYLDTAAAPVFGTALLVDGVSADLDVHSTDVAKTRKVLFFWEAKCQWIFRSDRKKRGEIGEMVSGRQTLAQAVAKLIG